MKNVILLLTALHLSVIALAQCPHIALDFINSSLGNTVTFVDQSQPQNGWVITENIWSYGDESSTVNSTRTSHTYKEPGIYNVDLTIKAATKTDDGMVLTCEETTTRQVTLTNTGMNDINSPDLTIYPNPSNGFIQIKNYGRTVKEIIIYDTNGEVLSQTDQVDGYIELPDNTNQTSYFVRVVTDNGDVVKRIQMVK